MPSPIRRRRPRRAGGRQGGLLGLRESLPPEELARGAGGWQHRLGATPRQIGQDLPRAPEGMRPLRLQKNGFHVRRELVGAVLGA